MKSIYQTNKKKKLNSQLKIEIVTESESNGEIVTVNASYLFTLHATYEQLENFPADENLGYKFMLYDEVFGGTGDEITSVNGGVIQ